MLAGQFQLHLLSLIWSLLVVVAVVATTAVAVELAVSAQMLLVKLLVAELLPNLGLLEQLALTTQ
jgi:hypothetical protein